MTSWPVEEIKDCCPTPPAHAVHMSWTRNQRKNNCSLIQARLGPRTKECRCVPFLGKVSHNPLGSTITAWVQKVARRQKSLSWSTHPLLLAPPCFSFCIPLSRDSPPLAASSRSCMKETEARDPISQFPHPTSSGLGKLWVCVRRKRKTLHQQQQQRHMTSQLSSRVQASSDQHLHCSRYFERAR